MKYSRLSLDCLEYPGHTGELSAANRHNHVRLYNMDLQIESGTYVVAVSGGVDSMVLLHLLSKLPSLTLVVAHYDHGIRSDSGKDRLLVQAMAVAYGLPFMYEEAHLGKTASEARARTARYTFLEKVVNAHNARAVITAHHQDDVLETAVINSIRGTGRKGLTALANTPTRVRPLLHIPKARLVEYAETHHLQWHEDSTNVDERYLRNYVRRQVLSRFTVTQRQRLLEVIERMRLTNAALDAALDDFMCPHVENDALARGWFITLPYALAREVLATWFRVQRVGSFDAKVLDRVTIMAKTLAPGGRIDVSAGVRLTVKPDVLALITFER